MAYHHVDRGPAVHPVAWACDPINAERQNVIANSIPDDNSFYSPGADEIQLGTGGVDDGEDADVIVHEYGHAVQDAQAPELPHSGNQGGAMGEGFGDYLAGGLLDRDGRLRHRVEPCIMEWDATSYDDNSSDPPRHLPAPRRRSRRQRADQQRRVREAQRHPLHRPGLVERPARPARSCSATTAAATAIVDTVAARVALPAADERDLRGGGRGADRGRRRARSTRGDSLRGARATEFDDREFGTASPADRLLGPSRKESGPPDQGSGSGGPCWLCGHCARRGMGRSSGGRLVSSHRRS